MIRTVTTSRTDLISCLQSPHGWRFTSWGHHSRPGGPPSCLWRRYATPSNSRQSVYPSPRHLIRLNSCQSCARRRRLRDPCPSPSSLPRSPLWFPFSPRHSPSFSRRRPISQSNRNLRSFRARYPGPRPLRPIARLCRAILFYR